MRVIVTGSRDWQDRDTVRNALSRVLARVVPDVSAELVVVHGACPTGADFYARQWVEESGDAPVSQEMHPAEWGRRGKAAGPFRNRQMVNAGADLCLAFIRNGSPGATHCANLAERAGIPTTRYLEGAR